jgi:YD repeat-containing protein
MAATAISANVLAGFGAGTVKAESILLLVLGWVDTEAVVGLVNELGAKTGTDYESARRLRRHHWAASRSVVPKDLTSSQTSWPFWFPRAPLIHGTE